MTGRVFLLRRAAQIAAALLLILPAASVETQQRPRDPGTGRVHQTDASYDWGWGELLYGQTYTTKLTITNKCRMPRVVNVFIYDPIYLTTVYYGPGNSVKQLRWRRPPIVDGSMRLDVPPGTKLPVSARAMLSIPAAGCVAVPFGPGSQTPTTCQMVVPPGPTEVDLTIVTPPPPDLSGVIIPPGFDPLTLYDEIAGELVAYHAGQPPACLASREEYLPSGHIHIDPNPTPPSAGGPRCRDWWDTERKPEGLTRDCTGEIRDLAMAYRRTTLAPRIEMDPEAWAWLPSEEAILTMSVEQLIAMKVRARTQVAQR